jgi:predicted ATPase
LIGLFWSLLEKEQLVLLEEPELSLHPEIVRNLSQMLYRVQKISHNQIFISTHSPDLLMDLGIEPAEVALLVPRSEETEVRLAAQIQEIALLMKNGLSAAEAAVPYAAPRNVNQLSFDSFWES